jgi:hypothetical protein
MVLVIMTVGLIVFALAALRWGADSTEKMDNPDCRRRPRPEVSPAAAPPLWDLSRFGITQPAIGASDPGRAIPLNLFAQAVREGSNLELDWLWLAGQVTRDAERRYCLERALYINPHSDAAQQGLATLARQTAPALEAPAFARNGGA